MNWQRRGNPHLQVLSRGLHLPVKRQSDNYEDDDDDDEDDERTAPLRSKEDTKRSDKPALGDSTAVAEGRRNRTGHPV